MTRRLRILCPALLTLFVVSGLAASTAAAGVLATTSYPAALTAQTGSNGTIFDFTGGEFVDYECGTMHLSSGTIDEPSATFTLHPVLTYCRHTYWATPITTTGCDFRFHIGETVGESGNYAGTVDLVCEAGKSLEFAPVFGCQVEVHAQEGFGSVEFVNSAGSPSDFTINWNVEGFQYTVIKDGFGCPYSGLGSREDGDFITLPTTVMNSGSGGVKIEM